MSLNSLPRTLKIAVRSVAAVAVAMGGCAGEPAQRPAVESVSADESTLCVIFSAAVELREVRIADEQGAILQTLPAAGTRRRFDFPVRLAPATRYKLELRADEQRWDEEIVTPTARPPLVATLEAPLGQQELILGSVATGAALVATEGEMALGLFIENRQQTPSQFELTIRVPEGVALELDEAEGEWNGKVWRRTGRLELEFDDIQILGRLRVASRSDAALHIDFSQSSGDSPAARQQLDLALRSATVEELSRQLELVEVAFPANASGQRRDEQLADAIVLPNPTWDWFRRLFRSSAAMFNFYEPYGYQAVTLANRGDVPLNILIESEVADPLSGTPLLDFAAPEWYSQRSTPTSEHLLRVPPGETSRAQLPLYVRPKVREGRYVRRLRVYQVGSRQPLLEASWPLAVLRGDPVVSAVVLASLTMCVIAWMAAALLGPRLVRQIGVDGLSTIGLVAALHFAVSYAASLAGTLISGFLGPFAVFVAGLGNELFPSLLLAAAVTLVPRIGTFTVSSLSVFLLNALFQGQLGVIDVLFVTLSTALGEACLLVLGVTTLPWRGKAIAHASASRTRPVLIQAPRLAMALGLANMVALYAQFCLIEVLYRLFFAGWYVAAVAVVTGFLYGGAGAFMGARLGSELRRTAR